MADLVLVHIVHSVVKLPLGWVGGLRQVRVGGAHKMATCHSHVYVRYVTLDLPVVVTPAHPLAAGLSLRVWPVGCPHTQPAIVRRWQCGGSMVPMLLAF